MKFFAPASIGASPKHRLISMPPQLEKAITSPLLVATWSALAFAIALFLCVPKWHGLFEVIPPEASLQEVEGTLTSFRQYTNEEGLRFQLSGSDDFFALSTYSGAEPAMRRAIPGTRFGVFFDPNKQTAPVWSNRRSYTVYVVFADGAPIRPYNMVAAEGQKDFSWTPWVGGLFALIGLALLLWALRLLFFASRPLPVLQKAG